MVRGNSLGNLDAMAEGYETGLGFLTGVGIDQHFTQRGRLPDMTGLMKVYPELLGSGLERAIVMRGVACGSVLRDLRRDTPDALAESLARLSEATLTLRLLHPPPLSSSRPRSAAMQRATSSSCSAARQSAISSVSSARVWIASAPWAGDGTSSSLGSDCTLSPAVSSSSRSRPAAASTIAS